MKETGRTDLAEAHDLHQDTAIIRGRTEAVPLSAAALTEEVVVRRAVIAEVRIALEHQEVQHIPDLALPLAGVQGTEEAPGQVVREAQAIEVRVEVLLGVRVIEVQEEDREAQVVATEVPEDHLGLQEVADPEAEDQVVDVPVVVAADNKSIIYIL